jgi:iron-sulfur cluster assembly accessory protein
MITLTENAAKHIKYLCIMSEEGFKGLRIRVVGGGCSGLSYKMDLDNPTEKDKTFTSNDCGGLLIVDKKSFLYLNGMVLDYNEGLMKSGFVMENPNISRQCGCGESFDVHKYIHDKHKESEK